MTTTIDNHKRRFIYRINQYDQITYINQDWLEFAKENDAAGLDEGRVLNRPVWDFVVDAETSHLHEEIATKVRRTGEAVRVGFRCDSPSVRRYMEMEISPYRESSIEYRCRILKIERRTAVPLLDSDVTRSNDCLRMCSWCKKVDIGDNNWQEIEDAVQNLRLFATSELPRISHTTCGECVSRLEMIKGLAPQKGNDEGK